MNQDDLAGASSNPLESYARVFRAHQRLVQDQLRGQSDDSEDLPSFVAPASHWTSTEKDLFFHSLKVHSRFRPELIAERIQTKSTLEVCLYIDVLQKAAARDSGHNSNPGIRDGLEPALEVSERWIEHEEEIARQLLEIDSCPCGLDVDRPSSTMPRCSCMSDEPLHDIDTNNRPLKYLYHLNSSHLNALEDIICDAEVKPAQGDISEAPSRDAPVLPGSTNLFANTELTLDAQSGSQTVSSEFPMVQDSNTAGMDLKSLRLLQKRLYMRRKRAQDAGRETIREDIMLPPGRMPGARKRQQGENYDASAAGGSSTNETAQGDPAGPEGVGENKDESLEMPDLCSKSGTMRPNNWKQTLMKSGVNAETLSGVDLDLFHLSTLGRLLRLFQSINDSPSSVDSASMSAKSILLLVAITKDFVSEVIRRSIITKEQEIRLKATLKVWGYDRDEISGDNIKECLNTMGLGTLNKKKYCAELRERIHHEAEEDLFWEDEDDPAMAIESQTQPGWTETQNKVHSRFTLPQSLLWCALPSHHEIFSNDNITLLEIDETSLSKELEEEDQLDAKDLAASKKYEDMLWANNVLDIP